MVDYDKDGVPMGVPMPVITRGHSLAPYVGKETYAQSRRRLEFVIKWLIRVIPKMTDQKLRSTRVYYYRNQIRKIERLHKANQTSQLSMKDFEDFIATIHDAHLLCDLHHEFRARKDQAFIKALEEVISGTTHTKDEKNPKPRNTLFELRTAGLFGSKNVSFEVEDFVAQVSGKRLGVECKRIQSDKPIAIERNFTEACRQLTKKLNENIIDAGVVAFQIDKIFNVGDKALLSPNASAVGHLAGNYIEKFLTGNRSLFLRNVDIRIIGVLAILIGPAIADKEKMPFYVLMSGANNLAISKNTVANNLKHYPFDPRYQLFEDMVRMLTPRKL